MGIINVYLPMSLFQMRTARPISTKFYDPANPTPCLGVPQTPKPIQIIGEKTLLCKKCPDGWLNINKIFRGSAMPQLASVEYSWERIRNAHMQSPK